jgi:hypothetical protein
LIAAALTTGAALPMLVGTAFPPSEELLVPPAVEL